MKARTLIINVLLAVAAALVFIPGIGSARLFDWDEINFAESAREMIETGDWMNVRINFESFWEKPPVFIWMQALSMKAFGVGEFAARFPNAIAGILTLLLFFNAGRKLRDERFGLIWAGLYAMSFFPFFYFKSGIIDPWFNLFIFSGIYFFALYSRKNSTSLAMLSATAIGLAILTKGPVAFLIFGLTFLVWLAFNKFRLEFRWKDVAAYLATLCIVGGSWFIVLAATGHGEVIQDFIDYQIRLFETKDAGHGGFFAYHFIMIFFGVAPASILALPAFAPSNFPTKDSDEGNMFRWMMAAFWVVLILFTIVKTKIIHYSSFCYFPLSFIAASSVSAMIDGKIKFRKYQSVIIIIIAVLLGIVFAALTQFDHFKEKLIPYIADPFAVSCMSAKSEWLGFEPLAGLVIIFCTIWFCIKFRKTRDARSLLILAAGNIFFLLTAMICAVSEVEKYSQASAVEFYVSKQNEDCYITPAYFKSYAQYFYSARKPENKCDDFEWLSKGPIDKPCYFVVKDIPSDIERFWTETQDAELLYKESGFLFFVRAKQTDKQSDKPCDCNEQK